MEPKLWTGTKICRTGASNIFYQDYKRQTSIKVAESSGETTQILKQQLKLIIYQHILELPSYYSHQIFREPHGSSLALSRTLCLSSGSLSPAVCPGDPRGGVEGTEGLSWRSTRRRGWDGDGVKRRRRRRRRVSRAISATEGSVGWRGRRLREAAEAPSVGRSPQARGGAGGCVAGRAGEVWTATGEVYGHPLLDTGPKKKQQQCALLSEEQAPEIWKSLSRCRLCSSVWCSSRQHCRQGDLYLVIS
jgi:hypothetical protein